jgi:hypothetical protein
MPSPLHRIPHRQVPAKVTVYVDEGIKELVELLNAIPNVCTIESCQGSDTRRAIISLDYGVDYTNSDQPDLPALAEFADKVWSVIRDSESQGVARAGISECTTLSIEWHPRYHPTLIINVEHRYIDDLVSILRPLCNGHILSKQLSKCEG